MRHAGLYSALLSASSMVMGQHHDFLSGDHGKPVVHNCREHHFGNFSDWSEPQNLGAVVNASGSEQWPAISPDDLSLYFSTNRAGGSGLQDIWVTQRANEKAPWEAPKNIGATVNSSARDNTPYVSADGHWLFFASNRPGGCGGSDLYVSFRAQADDDFAWGAPVNLGCQVNSATDDIAPNLLIANEGRRGRITLYFMSNRLGPFNIYRSTLGRNGAFSTPERVEELVSNSAAGDGPVWLRNDGLEMVLNWADNISLFVDSELWVSTRRSRHDPWSQPQLLTGLNTSFADASPSLSCDGTSLYFASDRPGGNGGTDLWVTIRKKEGKKH